MLVREALAAGLAIEAVYAAPGAPGDLLDAAVPVVHLAEGVAERVASTVSPQPVLAVAACCDVPLEAVRGATVVVVCDRLADPGNLGTILRTAEAAGVDAVVLTPGAVDPFNPKVVRASAGALFHVPVVVDTPLDAVRRELALPLHGTAATGGVPYTEAPLDRPCALVLGNEASGLDDTTLATLDGLVTIPHAGRAESLNVAMAAAVLCFEVARRRGPA